MDLEPERGGLVRNAFRKKKQYNVGKKAVNSLSHFVHDALWHHSSLRYVILPLSCMTLPLSYTIFPLSYTTTSS